MSKPSVGHPGAVGKPLVLALLAAGHQVTAMTRSGGTARALAVAGAEPVVADGLDRAAVLRTVTAVVDGHGVTGDAGTPTSRGLAARFADSQPTRDTATGPAVTVRHQGGDGSVIPAARRKSCWAAVMSWRSAGAWPATRARSVPVDCGATVERHLVLRRRRASLAQPGSRRGGHRQTRRADPAAPLLPGPRRQAQRTLDYHSDRSHYTGLGDDAFQQVMAEENAVLYRFSITKTYGNR